MGRYVVTAFAHGGNLGPTEVARHMRGISAHEIYTAGNKHSDPDQIYKASTDVINAFAKLDVASMWGDAQSAAVDGSQIDTWENNLLAESHIRYGGFGALAFRLVSDTYIALFSHFIPCGVWEAVYLLDSLLSNASDIQPDTIHADTQGASLPVFGLAALRGFELLPRIRNWHDLNFYRPDAGARYRPAHLRQGRHGPRGPCHSPRRGASKSLTSSCRLPRARPVSWGWRGVVLWHRRKLPQRVWRRVLMAGGMGVLLSADGGESPWGTVSADASLSGSSPVGRSGTCRASRTVRHGALVRRC